MRMKKFTFVLLVMIIAGSISFNSYSGLPFLVSQVGLPFVENFDGVGDETPYTWLPEGWATIDG
jgi:hypothetical protein